MIQFLPNNNINQNTNQVDFKQGQSGFDNVSFFWESDYQPLSSRDTIDDPNAASWYQLDRMIDIQAKSDTDATLNGGDDAKNKNQPALDYKIARENAVLGLDRPIFKDIGNHDATTETEIKAYMDKVRFRFERFVVGENKVDKGFYRVHFKGIDIFYLLGYASEISTEQRNWITSELSALEATERNDIRILLVVHAPIEIAWSNILDNEIEKEFVNFEYSVPGSIFMCSLSGHTIQRARVTDYPAGTVLVSGQAAITKDMVAHGYTLPLPTYSRQSAEDNLTDDDIAYAIIKYSRVTDVLTINAKGRGFNPKIELNLGQRAYYNKAAGKFDGNNVIKNPDFSQFLAGWSKTGWENDGNEVVQLIRTREQLPVELRHLFDSKKGHLIYLQTNENGEGIGTPLHNVLLGDSYEIRARLYTISGHATLGNRSLDSGFGSGTYGRLSQYQFLKNNEWEEAFIRTENIQVPFNDRIYIKSLNVSDLKVYKGYIDFITASNLATDYNFSETPTETPNY